MSDDPREYDLRKKAIFDAMSRRGQERILRIGYENWDPFQEPKDPRERIFSSASLKASALVKEFLQARGADQESPILIKDLFELCKGLLQGEARAQTILEFCSWYQAIIGKDS
jgi:broad specificity phosphatase PhoE